jgi:hypothetical protein
MLKQLQLFKEYSSSILLVRWNAGAASAIERLEQHHPLKVSWNSGAATIIVRIEQL